MIIYQFWFELKEDCDTKASLEFIDDFLQGKKDEGKLSNYRLLRNKNSTDTKLLEFHAMMEFKDKHQFEVSFSELRESGIKNGKHGEIVNMVNDFHVEFYEDININE